MNNLYEFDLHIYPIPIWIADKCDDDFLNYYFESVANIGDKDDALVQRVRKNGSPRICGILIRFRNKGAISVPVISHESAHAALCVFEDIEQPVLFDSQEPFAYLVGYLSDCINQVRINNVRNGRRIE